MADHTPNKQAKISRPGKKSGLRIFSEAILSLGQVTDGLDIVAVRIEDKGAIVVLMIVGA